MMGEDGYVRPQWMEARFKNVLKLPDCGRLGTHSACRCFLKKIIELEEELSRLRRYVAYFDNGETQ
jgi:hypothetical protein